MVKSLTTLEGRTMTTEHRLTTRLSAVGLGLLAACAAWLVATRVAGASLELTSAGTSTSIGLGQVVPAALVAMLGGWAVLTLLERRASDPRGTWTVLALGFAAASLIGPGLVPGLATGDRIWLASLHLLVAATYVPTMRRSVASARGTRVASSGVAATP